MLLKQLLFIMKTKLKHYNICCVDSCLRKYNSMAIYFINAIRKQLIHWKNAFDCSISHLHFVLDKRLNALCFNALPQHLRIFIQMQHYSFLFMNVLNDATGKWKTLINNSFFGNLTLMLCCLLVLRPSDWVSPHLQKKRENISASLSTYALSTCLLCLCSILRTEAVPYMHNTYTGSTHTVFARSL